MAGVDRAAWTGSVRDMTTPFAPETVLPSQLGGRPPQQGERLLLLAVLEDAVDCYRKCRGSRDPALRLPFDETRAMGGVEGARYGLLLREPLRGPRHRPRLCPPVSRRGGRRGPAALTELSAPPRSRRAPRRRTRLARASPPGTAAC